MPRSCCFLEGMEAFRGDALGDGGSAVTRGSAADSQSYTGPFEDRATIQLQQESKGGLTRRGTNTPPS